MEDPKNSRRDAPTITRRELLARSGIGLAGLALAQLADDPVLAQSAAGSPLA